MRAMSAIVLLVLAGVISTTPAQTKKSPAPSAKSPAPSEKDKDKDKETKPEAPTSYGGKTLAQWMRQLTDPDASKRSLAIMAIMQFGDASKAAVPLLIQRTRDKDASPRSKALYALRHVAVDDKDAPKVVDALAVRMFPKYESQISVRYEAAMTLKRFAKEAKPAIPALIQGTMDKGSWELRHQCAWLLWRIADPADRIHGEAVDAIHDLLLNDKTYLVRLEAIQGLGRMGRPTDPARLSKVIETLTRCTNPSKINDENRPLAIWAFASLVNIQDEGQAQRDNLAKLAKYLAPSWGLEVRSQAAQAIGSLGAKAKSKIPVLIKMLNDKQPVAIMGACMALAGVGEKDDKVIEGLLEVVDHKEAYCAATAVISLVNLKADAPSVLKKFQAKRDEKGVNDELRKTLGQAIKALKEKKTSK
jgi:HEAT repeat protein